MLILLKDIDFNEKYDRDYRAFIPINKTKQK